MKKVNGDIDIKAYVPIGLVLLIIIGVVAVMSGMVNLSDLKLGSAYTGSTGFTVNSISPTTVISNDADIAGASFIITLTANGGGQSVVGTIGQEEFKKWMPNLIVQAPLQIGMGEITEQVTYPIKSNQEPFGRYSYLTQLRPDYFSGATCTGKGYAYCYTFNNVAATSGLGDDMIFGVNKVNTGIYGQFENPTYTWSGTMTVWINGVPTTKTIGSTGTAAGSMNSATGSVTFNEYVTAQWTGNLLTGDASPNHNNYRPYWAYSQNKWRVAPATVADPFGTMDTDLRTTLSGLQNKINTCYLLSPDLTDPLCEPTILDPIKESINNINAKEDTFVAQNAQITSASSGISLTTTPSGTNTGGNIVVKLDRRLANPQIVLRVKASQLGVLIPVGKPEIVSIESKPFLSGDNSGLASITVKNIGAAAGTFQATMSEPTGTFTQISTVGTSQINLAAGQTGVIPIHIGHGAIATAQDRTATATVYDYNKPSNFATKNFIISMGAPLKCTPGKVEVDGSVVRTCKPDGSGFALTLDCTGKLLSYSGGDYSCKTSGGGEASGQFGSNNSDGSVTDGSVTATTPNWYDTTPAKILAGLIFVLIVILYWRKQDE